MPAPVISEIPKQIIAVNTDYRITVSVTNLNPATDTVEVLGLLQGFSHSVETNAVVIYGRSEAEIGLTKWDVIVRNTDGSDDSEIFYEVVAAIPIISEDALKVARGVQTSLLISVANRFSDSTLRGPLIGLISERETDGIRWSGVVPEDATFSSEMGKLMASVSSSGGSDSADILFDILDPLPAPANLRGTSTRAGIITLNWNAVPGAASYQIRQGADGEWRDVTGTSIVLSEVYEAGTFSFYARAVNADGVTGHISAVANVIVVRVVVPGVVASFTVTVSGTTIIVSWTPPTNDGGGAITGYRIVGSLPTITPTASERSRTFLDLADGTYFFEIQAQNSEGYGASSARRSVSVFTTVPDAPILSGFLSGTSGRLSWNTPYNGGRVIQYYQISINFGSWFSVGNTNSYTSNNLPVGTTSFRVRANNSNGFSAASNSVSITRATVPDFPTSLRVVGSTFLWNAPSSDGGSPITSYRYNVGSGWFTWTSGVGPSISTSPGTYTLQVQAVNAIGGGPIASITHTIAQTLPPLSPVWVSLTINNSGNPVAVWSDPSPSDRAATSYDIQWTISNAPSSEGPFNHQSTSYNIPRFVAQGASILVQIRARNSNGVSSFVSRRAF